MYKFNKNIIKKINENKYVKKTRKGLGSLIFSRAGLFAFLVILQLVLMIYIYYNSKIDFTYIMGGDTLSKFIMMLIILNMKKVSNANKLSWFMLIAIVPTFGIIAFLVSHYSIGYKREQRKVISLDKDSRKYIKKDKDLYEKIEDRERRFYPIAKYLDDVGGFPTYKDTSSTYFKVGDDMFEAMLSDVKSAEDFIFMEFFIIDYGYMWGTILEELVKKAKEGVKVRLLIDGSNLITRVRSDFPQEMESLGIECRVFSKMYPIVSTYQNNRDHRKVMVVDGKIAYTGGINLSDEYINVYERFGHWKDCGVRIKGSAVKSFTTMFLNMWFSLDNKPEDYSPYLKKYPDTEASGFYIPFADNPLDDETISKNVLLDTINKAKKYVYLMSPYLIVDEEIRNSIKLASKSGLDVRICLPHIPDKKVAFALAKDHYKEFIEAGVRIFEYTPGFVHSKTWLADGKVGFVGTVNLDYRALYQNFECGLYMYKSNSLADIRNDFDIFFEVGQEVNMEDVENIKLSSKIFSKIVKPFAVLM